MDQKWTFVRENSSLSATEIVSCGTWWLIVLFWRDWLYHEIKNGVVGVELLASRVTRRIKKGWGQSVILCGWLQCFEFHSAVWHWVTGWHLVCKIPVDGSSQTWSNCRQGGQFKVRQVVHVYYNIIIFVCQKDVFCMFAGLIDRIWQLLNLHWLIV